MARRVLFIDDTVPVRQLGSGFVRSNDLIRVIAALGYSVTVYPINSCPLGVAAIYADMPDTVEVMHDRTIETFAAFLAARQGYYDVIWIARTHNLDRAQPLLERFVTEWTATHRAGHRGHRRTARCRAVGTHGRGSRRSRSGDPA